MRSSKIASHQAQYTLGVLHAELAGKLIENEKEAERLRESMRHVEAVLKLLDPTYSVRGISLRRKVLNGYFKRGTMFRSALEVLRKTQGPLTAREITLGMLAAKGVAKPSKEDIQRVTGGVLCSLRNHNGDSVVSDGRAPSRWKLKA